ncbi:MAG: VTT domain-containing protein [Burkholderiales bacterium]|jgi:membrane-associated protein
MLASRGGIKDRLSSPPMDLSGIVDVLLHLDKHLAALAQAWGPWIYAALFAVIFVETGLVVMPFLPGDSLLFVAGAIAGLGGLDLFTLCCLLSVAAILGDFVNYSVGRRVGARVFAWEDSRWFHKQSFERTQAFYDRYGAVTIIVGRFLPFVRTFAPFVAGVAAMNRKRFVIYNIVGALIWVVGLCSLGYVVGNTSWVQANFSLVTLLLIVVPGMPAIIEVLRQWLRSRRGTA